MTVKYVAWCPDDCGVEEAREYVGSRHDQLQVQEIAEEHAEWMHSQGDPQSCYNIHVSVMKGEVSCEWSVRVDVMTEVSFMGHVEHMA